MNKLFEKSSKLRSLRQQVVGVERIKDDPFANDRLELEEYEKVVGTCKSAIDRFNDALSELHGVHAEMIASLKKFHEFNQDISQKKRIDIVESALESIDIETNKCHDSVDVVVRKLDALLAMHAGLSSRLLERDKSHAAKAHYESKLQSLSEKDQEKLQRNVKKQEEAQSEFEKSEEITIRECRDALNTRWKDMDQILGLYIKSLSGCFGGIYDRFSALESLTEDMIQTRSLNREVEEVPLVEEPLESDVKNVMAQHAKSADDDHDALRTALGLRLKGRGPEIMVTDFKGDSDKDSDLFTPKSVAGR
jgi:hypothetical protein